MNAGSGEPFFVDARQRYKGSGTVDIESRNAARLMQMNRGFVWVCSLDAYRGIAELDLDLGIGTIIQCIPMPGHGPALPFSGEDGGIFMR